jgi:hypothetical protein
MTWRRLGVRSSKVPTSATRSTHHCQGASRSSAFPGSAEFSKKEAFSVGGVPQHPSPTQCLGLFRPRWHCPRFIQCGLGLGVEVDILMWQCLTRHPKNLVQLRVFVCSVTDSGNVFGHCKKITFGTSRTTLFFRSEPWLRLAIASRASMAACPS